jgi:tetratricopeptide (TPR) repeat protein
MKTIWWCERVCSKVSSRKRGFWGTHEPQMDKKSSKRSSVSGIPLGGGTWGTMVRLGVVVGLCWVGLAVYAELPSEGEKVASGQVSAERLPPLDEVEKAVLQADTGVGTLRENWEPVVRLLKPVTVQTPDAVYRLIKAHACLAVNENNEAVCLFLSVSEKDRQRWYEWVNGANGIAGFVARYPKNSIAYYYSGDAHARLKQWDKALTNYEEALRLAGSIQKALVYNARGVVYAHMENFAQARIDFDSATTTNSELADAWANIGSLRIHIKEGAEGALKAFDKALKSSPNFALALHQRGCIKLILNKDASEDWKRAIEIAGCGSAVDLMLINQVSYVARAKGIPPQEALAELRVPGSTLNRQYSERARSAFEIADAFRGASWIPFNQHIADFFANRGVEATERMSREEARAFYKNNPSARQELARVGGYNQAIRGFESLVENVGTATTLAGSAIRMPKVAITGKILETIGNRTGRWSDTHRTFAETILDGIEGPGSGFAGGNRTWGSAPGGVHINLNDIAWDDGMWPFVPWYSLSYDTFQLPTTVNTSTKQGSCLPCEAKKHSE